MMTLTEALPLLAAHGLRSVGDARFTEVGADSRAIVPGQLFVALRGEHFDGHDFVDAALADGAAAAMVDAHWDTEHPQSEVPRIVVGDTRIGLGALAAGWRARFDIPLIGVTGSNGKTTVKEMCAAILRAWLGDEAVQATKGNFNNDIGLPLSLLGLRAHHKAAVIEMGMNHPGEIAYLAALARPTVALVNNAQRAHLEGMGSVDGVAREKGRIYEGLTEKGIAVLNVDDVHAEQWLSENVRREIVSFGVNASATVYGHFELHGLGSTLRLETPWGHTECALQVPGAHNAHNALAAAAACLSTGAPLAAVASGLAHYGGAHGRLQRRAGPRGALVLDDSYNANPDSVRAGIDVLVGMPGRTILVFGDMGEVGETSAREHAEIGTYAKDKKVDRLYTLGVMSEESTRHFGEGGQHFTSVETLLEALAPTLGEGDTVLVKASRFMRMERVTEALAALAGASQTEGGH